MGRRAAGPGMLVSSSAAVQVAAALSVPGFATVGVAATSGVRFLVAAGVLLAFVRPRLAGRSRADWAWIVALGTVAIAMNMSFYEAVHRLPLGTAVTVEFLGPLAIAVLASRRRIDLLCAALAAVGVLLLAGPSVHVSAVGLVFAGLAAVAEATYLMLSNSVGLRAPGFEGLALAVGVAALLTLPFSLPAVGHLDAGVAVRVAASGALGIALAYLLEMQALRLSGPRAVGIFFSLDPAVATVVGLVLLGQTLGPISIMGLIAVVAAGCLTSATRSLG